MTKMKPKECQNIEYKKVWQDEFLKWICGFANSQGAVLYIGVDDDHEVVGLDNVERLLDDIPNERATIDDLDRGAIDYFLHKGIRAGRICEDEADASTQSVLDNLNLVSEDGKLKNAALLLFAKIEVPEDALREIFYNAIAHKDYMGAPIQMRIWDDYCEVWNEGVLPEGLTPEMLLDKHSSHPRNENIAYTFFKAGFIESWGRGYKKIHDGFEKAGLPIPTIETVEGGIRVTFKRNNVNSSQTGKNVIENSHQDAVDVLQNAIESSATLAVYFNVSERTIRRDLQTLQLKGIIRHVGPDKGGCWEIIIKG